MRSHQNILILPKPTIIQNNIHTKHTHTCTEYVYICFFFPFWTSGTWLFLSHRAKWRCDNQKGKRTPKQYVRPKDIHDTYQNCDKTIHRNRTHIHPACNKINDKYSSNNNQIKKKPKYTTPKPTTKKENNDKTIQLDFSHFYSSFTKSFYGRILRWNHESLQIVQRR